MSRAIRDRVMFTPPDDANPALTYFYAKKVCLS